MEELVYHPRDSETYLAHRLADLFIHAALPWHNFLDLNVKTHRLHGTPPLSVCHPRKFHVCEGKAADPRTNSSGSGENNRLKASLFNVILLWVISTIIIFRSDCIIISNEFLFFSFFFLLSRSLRTNGLRFWFYGEEICWKIVGKKEGRRGKDFWTILDSLRFLKFFSFSFQFERKEEFDGGRLFEILYVFS